jgi:hypothetical protein
MAQPDASRLHQPADDVGRHEFSIPIARTIQLQEIQEAHRISEKGGLSGKVAGSVSHEGRYFSFVASGMPRSASFQSAPTRRIDARYADCFAGVSAIRAMPTIMRAGTSPIRCPRSL